MGEQALSDGVIWVAVLLVAAVSLVVWNARWLRHKLRERDRALEIVKHKRVIAEERARIARDIHDDLGAALTEIALLADVGSGNPSAEVADHNLRTIAARAREAMLSLEEIVWAVDLGNDNLRRLADHLCSLAEGCFEVAGIRCRREVPTGLPEIVVRADVRHNVAMAVKEALVNAVRHSGAREVRLGLAWDPPLLRIEVEDDGRGLGSAGSGGEGHGLRNLRDRMSSLGGVVRLGPGSRGGTRVNFELELDVAEGDVP